MMTDLIGPLLPTVPPAEHFEHEVRLQTLMRVATRSVSADGAQIFARFDGEADPRVFRFGRPFDLSFEQLMQRGCNERVAYRAEQNSDGEAFVSVPFPPDAKQRGFLCVYGPKVCDMSPAQDYALAIIVRETAMVIEASKSATNVPLGRSDFERQRERLRLLESVVVTANDSVLITEAEPINAPGPRILYANAAFTRTTGYTLEEILGKTPRILQGEGTDPEIRRRLREALGRWEPIEIELLNYRKDGSSFWSELSIVPVADESGTYTHWVSVQRDVTERKLAEELATRARVAQAELDVLAYRASHDDLTGLANRTAFVERLSERIAAVRADAAGFAAIFFLDLDRFKLINDSLGHRIGDQLLIEVARRLTSSARTGDVIARFGGDEFTFLINAVNDVEDIAHIARRILDTLKEPFRLAGQQISVAASIGISVIDDRQRTTEDLVRDADNAMYRAKKDGGSRYIFFDDAMHAQSLTILRAQMDLAGALARRELYLEFQPIVEAASGETTAVEALLRWAHPERGVVMPGDFIDVAEDTGLIVEIGRWVLQEACEYAQRLNAALAGSRRIKMNVNVSSRQLDARDFYDILTQVLDETGLDPVLLQLEITESVFLEHQEVVGALLKRIRQLGVRVALDDFGTGYSSLSYLERYPVDTLKIDRSFVNRLATSPTTIEIVRLMVGIARALTMDVTAEGVEDRVQYEHALEAGCSHIQGYFFSTPRNATHLLEALKTNVCLPIRP